MRKTILLVEDDEHQSNIINTKLAKEGYRVLAAETMREAAALLDGNLPNLIVLDIMLPDGNGLDFCRRVRERHDMPILFLTALGENEDIVRGLALGGDDYLAKPFDLAVLCARIKALLRRSGKQLAPLRVGGLELNPLASRAYLDGDDLLLTPREYALLELLLRNQNSYLSTKELYEMVWGMAAINTQPVKQLVYRLREKLGNNATVALESEQGKGYRLAITKGG